MIALLSIASSLAAAEAAFVCELRIMGSCTGASRRATSTKTLSDWFDFHGKQFKGQFQAQSTCVQRASAWRRTCGVKARVEHRVRRSFGAHMLEHTTASERNSDDRALMRKSVLGRGGQSPSATRLPCCLELGYDAPEANATARCAWVASEGRCWGNARRACPFACGMCRHCLGTCTAESMMSLRTKAPLREPTRANEEPTLRNRAVLRAGLRDVNVSTNVWCTTYPRCKIFGCCDQYPFCHHSSTQTLAPPPARGTRHTDTRGHPRFSGRQTPTALDDGLAALPFTTPTQFTSLSRRAEFRIAYCAQGKNGSALPPEYELLRRPGSGRHFFFSAFKADSPDDVYFPRSNIGEGRNMLYLAVREQEMRQGWLYNYVVILDDDLEFDVYDRTHATRPRVPLSEYAQRRRVPTEAALEALLADWEAFLARMEPAVGALCWGSAGCPAQFWVQSTCHTDHKIVAYHREALETLLPMPTHRDGGCWWASQFINTMEASLHFRGRTMYYPGALRVAGGFKAGDSKYEAHNAYPRDGCEAPEDKPFQRRRGVFSLLYGDLRATAMHSAWRHGTMRCFDQLVARCRRNHGVLDLPATPKHQPYYTHPSHRSFVQPCFSVVESTWTLDGVSAALAKALLPVEGRDPELQSAKDEEVASSQATLALEPWLRALVATSMNDSRLDVWGTLNGDDGRGEVPYGLAQAPMPMPADFDITSDVVAGRRLGNYRRLEKANRLAALAGARAGAAGVSGDLDTSSQFALHGGDGKRRRRPPLRVLITGVTGMIGSNIAAALLARTPIGGTRLRATRLFGMARYRSDMQMLTALVGSAVSSGRLELLRGDLDDAVSVREIVAVSKPDVVIHLAAQAYNGVSWGAPLLTLRQNILGTAHLLEALRSLNLTATRVLMAASSAQYGDGVRQLANSSAPFPESTPQIPLSPYGVSKAAMESLGRQYALNFGMKIAFARLFPQVGVGQSEQLALQSFARQIAIIEYDLERGETGGRVRVGDLSTRRDYSDVEETAVGLAHLALRGEYEPGEAFNFASGVAHSMRELLTLMLEQLVPEARGRVGIVTDASRIRPADEALLLGDASKVRDRLGWAPNHNLSRSIRRVLQYWRAKVRKEG